MTLNVCWRGILPVGVVVKVMDELASCFWALALAGMISSFVTPLSDFIDGMGDTFLLSM